MIIAKSILLRQSLGVAFFSLLAIAQVFAQPRATPVGVDAVRMEPMSQTVPVIGRFVALQSGEVAARTAGPVAKVHVNVGDHVEKGDLLVELDRARLETLLALQEAQNEELKASKKTAQANEKLAQQDLQRMEKLRDSAAFTRYDYDKRVQELAAARASREQTEARIVRGNVQRKLAEIELKDGQIRAPFPGVITMRQVSEGGWLRVNDPVVTLLNDSDLEIEADVPAERLQGLNVGTEVTLVVDSDEYFKATVRALIPNENPAARTRPVRFSPAPEVLQNQLAVNQPATLLLPASGETEVLTVAKDAILRRGPQAVVFLVQDGKASPRPVQLGEPLGNRFHVLHGLRPDDLVVIRGNERLRPGQAVAYPGQKPSTPGPDEKGQAPKKQG